MKGIETKGQKELKQEGLRRVTSTALEIKSSRTAEGRVNVHMRKEFKEKVAAH